MSRARGKPNYNEMSDDDGDSEFDEGVAVPKRAARGRGRKKVEESDEDDFAEEEEEKPAKKKAAKKKPTKRAPKKEKDEAPTRKRSRAAPKVKKETAPKQLKKLTVTQQLDEVVKANKWWEDEELPEGTNWKTMAHNAVMFPGSYRANGCKMLYDGKPVDLTPQQEELAMLYAVVPPDGPQLGAPKIAKVFNANFFKDFQEVLGDKHVIKTFAKCDFSPMRELILRQREERKGMTKEEKVEEKEIKAELARPHQYSLVDGNVQKVGNSTVEPPGLFRGRGTHPKTGTLKRRVMPENIMLNMSEEAVPPTCAVPGHAWQDIVHRPDVTWLAFWNENVMNGTKYVYLGASAGFKGKSDMKKYETARRLCSYIGRIRADYERNLTSDKATAQLATAMWVIDQLALRVGGEKSEDEADTVGCCSLRVEHVKFHPPASIELDFLGKDSMRYHQTVDLATYGVTGKKVYANMKRFSGGKSGEDQVFDELSPEVLNKHLSSLMPGLTAKVFRTYNASITLEEQLEEHTAEIERAANSQEQKRIYDAANREVAILCNHQRTVPKTHKEQVGKMGTKLELYEEQLKTLKKHLGMRKKDKDLPLREAKIEDKDERLKQGHLFSRQPTVDQVTKKIASWNKKIGTLMAQLQNKEDNATVALGTSKINYMDPRISVAWCKRYDVPIERIFAGALRDKFSWAMSAPGDWRFPPGKQGERAQAGTRGAAIAQQSREEAEEEGEDEEGNEDEEEDAADAGGDDEDEDDDE